MRQLNQISVNYITSNDSYKDADYELNNTYYTVIKFKDATAELSDNRLVIYTDNIVCCLDSYLNIKICIDAISYSIYNSTHVTAYIDDYYVIVEDKQLVDMLNITNIAGNSKYKRLVTSIGLITEHTNYNWFSNIKGKGDSNYKCKGHYKLRIDHNSFVILNIVDELILSIRRSNGKLMMYTLFDGYILPLISCESFTRVVLQSELYALINKDYVCQLSLAELDSIFYNLQIQLLAEIPNVDDTFDYTAHIRRIMLKNEY